MTDQVGIAPFEWAVDSEGYALSDDGHTIERKGGALLRYSPEERGSAYRTHEQQQALARRRSRAGKPELTEPYRSPMHLDFMRSVYERDCMELPAKDEPFPRVALLRLASALREQVAAVPALKPLAHAAATWCEKGTLFGSPENQAFVAALAKLRSPAPAKRPRGRPRASPPVTIKTLPSVPEILQPVKRELVAFEALAQLHGQRTGRASLEETVLWLVNQYGFLGSATRGPDAISEPISYITEHLARLVKLRVVLGAATIPVRGETLVEPQAVSEMFGLDSAPLSLDFALAFDPLGKRSQYQLVAKPRCLIDYVWTQTLRDVSGGAKYAPCASCGRLMLMRSPGKRGRAQITCSDPCRQANRVARGGSGKQAADLLSVKW